MSRKLFSTLTTTLPRAHLKPWHTPTTQTLFSDYTSEYANYSLDSLDTELSKLLTNHEIYNDKECINLNAATNVCNPKCGKFLSSTIGTRPSLGDVGNKYNRGMKYAERIECMCNELLCKLFNSKYSEFRVPSGCIANLYSYMSCCEPGDNILVLSPIHSGHVTHHTSGAAGLYRLNVHYLPFDQNICDIDYNQFKLQLETLKPSLVIIGSSMCFYPMDISAIRDIIDNYNHQYAQTSEFEPITDTISDIESITSSIDNNRFNAKNSDSSNTKKIKKCFFMYDAAHMGGMIAGGAFQPDPLGHGIDIMSGSTYKSFGGPNCGFIVTNDVNIAERIDYIAHPGMTANFDLGKTGALCVSIMDLMQYGKEYSNQCVKNAQSLSESLYYEAKLPIWKPTDKFTENKPNMHEFTQTQFVAMSAEWDWLNKDKECRNMFEKGEVENKGRLLSMFLERFNILTTEIVMYDGKQGVRMGTPELTRLGMKEDDMREIARFFHDIFTVLENEDRTEVERESKSILEDVVDFRKQFQKLHYVRE